MGRTLAPFEQDSRVDPVSTHLRSHMKNAPAVADGTLASSQVAGDGAYDVNADIALYDAAVDGRLAQVAAVVNFDVDNDANAKLWPGFGPPGSLGAGFKLTIVGGTNVMAADIVIVDGDIPTKGYLNLIEMAALLATKINAIANGGAGTVTVVGITGKLVFDSQDGTNISTAAPDGTAVDWNTILHGGNLNAAAASVTGAVPNPYDGEVIDYAVVSRKAGGGGLETVVAESAPYLASINNPLSIARSEVDKAVGSEFWAGIAMMKVTRDGDGSLSLNIDRNFQEFGYFLRLDNLR